AEMDVEDLLARAEEADDVEDLLARFLEHLRDGALTEVEPVIGILVDGDEPLQAVDRSEDGLDALIAAVARHARILRMTGEPHLVLPGHRHDAIEEIGDAPPVEIRRHDAR